MASEKRLGGPDVDQDTGVPVAKRAKDSHGERGNKLNSSLDIYIPHLHGGSEQAEDSSKRSSTQEIDIDLVICNLTVPECGAEVTKLHSNVRTADRQVQAYAKLAGRNWTFYVQKLELVIGRYAGPPNEPVDIDLAPSKVVSRRHAVIRYNLQTRAWEIVTIGRNGLRLDGELIKCNRTAELESGQVLDIGGVQMMFVLPDREPAVSAQFVRKAQECNQNRLNAARAIKHGPGLGHNEDSARSEDGSVAPRTTTPPTNGDASKSGLPYGSRFEGYGKPESTSAYPRGVTMVTRPQVPSSQVFDYDLSSDQCKDIKPPFSYATMISQAILSTPEHMMSLADIYAWIASHYAYYRRSKPGWQNSIRHNLSLNKAFEKVARRENEPGKGSKWHIVDAFKDDLIRRATTGKQYRGGAYLPRRPYEDSPPPAAVAAAAAAAGTKFPKGLAMMPPVVDPGVVKPEDMYRYEQQQREEAERQRKIKEMQQAHEQVMQQRGPQASLSQATPSQHGQQHGQQQSFAPQMAPPYNSMHLPPGQQPGYPVPMQFPDGSSYPVQQGFQYLQAFGMPYYPQQPGQPGQPGQPMIPMMPYPSQQPPQPAESPTRSKDQNKENIQKQPESHPHDHQHREHPHDHQHGHQHGHQHQDHHQPDHQHQDHQHQHGYQYQQTQTQSEAEETSEKSNGREQPELTHHNGLELQTPAKSLSASSRDDMGMVPQLGSAIKLDSTHVGAPESSPALWKYMNLESTPNNAASTKIGANENSGPESSPPHSGGADLSASLPLLKNLENSRV